MISWTPYAVVCLYRAFLENSSVSPLAATIPAFFGKFSLAWPALISLFGNTDIKRKLCRVSLKKNTEKDLEVVSFLNFFIISSILIYIFKYTLSLL